MAKVMFLLFVVAVVEKRLILRTMMNFMTFFVMKKKITANVVWVLGPAVSFDKDARHAVASLVKKGYVQGLLAGNALATHDLEGAYLNTALGQDIYTQESVKNGHYNHLDLLNQVRGYGSIKKFIQGEGIDTGIIHSCITNDVPFCVSQFD